MMYLGKKPSTSSKKSKQAEEISQEVEIQLNEEIADMFGGPDLGVSVEDNRIYFYTDVSQESVHKLNKALKKLDLELQMAKLRFAMPFYPQIELHIQSNGGDAFAGFSAVDAIRSCVCPVHTFIDGGAASAATIMSVAGTKRFATKNSFMLIHQLSAYAHGTHKRFQDEMQNQQELMSKLLTIYAEHSTMTRAEVEECLKHDLWFNADKCLSLGLIDEVL